MKKLILTSFTAAFVGIATQAQGPMKAELTAGSFSATNPDPELVSADGWIRISPDNYLFDCASDNSEEHFHLNSYGNTGANPSVANLGNGVGSLWQVTDASTQKPILKNWVANEDPNHLIPGGTMYVSAGQATPYENLYNGKTWKIQDLGMLYGKALCWIGSGVPEDVMTKLNDKLALNYTKGEAFQAFHTTFFPLYRPSYFQQTGGYLRFTIVYNYYHSTEGNHFAKDNFFALNYDNYVADLTNGHHIHLQMPTSHGNCGPMSAEDGNFTWESEHSKNLGEKEWNPEKWTHQSIIIANDQTHAPLWLTIKQPAGGYLNNSIMMIAGITLEWRATLPEEPSEAPRRKAQALNTPVTYNFYAPIGNTVLSGLKDMAQENVEIAVSGNTLTSNASDDVSIYIYIVTGAKVAELQGGESITLAKGIYIARDSKGNTKKIKI